MYTYVCNKLSLANNLQIYRTSQEETSIFSGIIISVIVRKNTSYEHVSNLEWLPR